MTTSDRDASHAVVDTLARRLLERRAGSDHWDGHLSSSALSTATAVLALEMSARNGHPGGDRLRSLASAGSQWLLRHQNVDGGWGDTVRSRSNTSTTAIVWATLSFVAPRDADVALATDRAAEWLGKVAGSLSPQALRNAILERYGKDKTFSVPILTVLALTGKLGEGGWRAVPQLPFELAALPHTWFARVQLPVVSYALPALIAIGQVRHHFAPSRFPLTRLLRHGLGRKTRALLRAMQPESGGYLEAAPLTSFVVMSLAAMRLTGSPVVDAGIAFLVDTVREDGSWPIDTNLSTWVTSLSINALSDAATLPAQDAAGMREWLLGRQSTGEHPFTHAAPGAWAWTPLSGGVPDADDTSGALVALRRLGHPDAATITAASIGVEWLLGVQNRDGGIPTFCRGWGALPFDRSTPEITAHALQAWSAWHAHLDPALRRRTEAAAARALEFLRHAQRPDGSWIPLWFGNEHAPDEENPVYGTGRVLLGLHAAIVADDGPALESRRTAIEWLLRVQNADGGWGGAHRMPSSIEETGVALAALSRSVDRNAPQLAAGVRWLCEAVGTSRLQTPSPIGLYFARLWYCEDLYPVVFALGGLGACLPPKSSGAA